MSLLTRFFKRGADQATAEKAGEAKPEIYSQEDDGPTIPVDTLSISHVFLMVTPDDYGRYGDELPQAVKPINRAAHPRIFREFFSATFCTLAGTPDSTGHPSAALVVQALKQVGMPPSSSVVVTHLGVRFDRGRARSESSVICGFAFTEDRPRLILARTDGCVAAS